MRTKTELTARGRMVVVLAALSLCGAWITRDENACLAAALLLAPLLVDRLWRARPFPKLSVEAGARRTQVGIAFVETLRVRNPGRRALHDLRITEPRVAASGSAGWIDTLPPGGSAELALPSRCSERGWFRRRVFVAETSYPLGLVVDRVQIACDVDLIAEPARIDLPAALPRSLTDPESAAETGTRGSGAFWALREYRWGEDARRVHALRSAASGSLVASVTRGEQPRDLCLVLDLRVPPQRSVLRPGPRFEWALSAAASVVDAAQRSGTPLLCIAIGRTPEVFSIHDLASAAAFLAFLAAAEPSRHVAIDPELRALLEQQRRGFWLAAGGHAAPLERDRARELVLLTEQRESA